MTDPTLPRTRLSPDGGPVADLSPALPAAPASPVSPASPLPAKWAHLLALLGVALAGASTFIPAPFQGPAAILGFVLAALGGVAAPVPSWAPSAPILKGALASIAGTGAGVGASLVTLLPAGWPQGVGVAVAATLAWLGGSTLEAPKSAGGVP